MPAAISIAIRREIVERHQQSESYASIARRLSMPYVTVRGIDQHYRKTGRLEPLYANCRPPAVRKDQAIYQRALQLKQAHPSWGAGIIWVELAEEFAEAALPSWRTLQRWFRRAGLNAPPAELPRPIRVKRGQQAHEVWALDAKEDIQLSDGSYVSWLTISDEGSGAILSVDLFPPQTVGKH
jgi:transposase